MIINEQVGKAFKLSRGIRQGDPLSPFLFLICSEGLPVLMKLALSEGRLKKTKVSRKGPQISHLLFTDDCVLFGEANEKGGSVLKEVLKEYERCQVNVSIMICPQYSLARTLATVRSYRFREPNSKGFKSPREVFETSKCSGTIKVTSFSDFKR